MLAIHPEKPLVLAVDDSDDDLLFMEIVAKELTPPIDFKYVVSGEEAIAYITGREIYSDRTVHPMPLLMFLDLKLPRISGFDVLAALSQVDVREKPFICVLSSSLLDSDVEKAMALGADDFRTKPSDLTSLRELLQNVTSAYCWRDRGQAHEVSRLRGSA